MNVIPTRIHGFLDYIMGLVLIVAPFVLGFADGGAEQWVPILLGAGTILYSLITDYELGLAGIIPMTVHLGLDAVAGVFLAASPWLFGFSDDVWAPHLILGLLEVGAVILSQRTPEHGAGRTRQNM
jgi:hypothetical protein